MHDSGKNCEAMYNKRFFVRGGTRTRRTTWGRFNAGFSTRIYFWM